MSLIPMYVWDTEPKWFYFGYLDLEYEFTSGKIEIEGTIRSHRRYIQQGDLVRVSS